MSLTFTYHLAQAVVNGYTGYLSHNAIMLLKNYEERTEKAAQYSNTAAEQLHKTRTTQAAGAITILFSLASTVYLVATADTKSSVPLILCVVNSVSLSLAYQHISSFWQHKAKVPIAKDYNDAITLSNVYRQYLVGLALSWWIAAAYYFPKLLMK